MFGWNNFLTTLFRLMGSLGASAILVSVFDLSRYAFTGNEGKLIIFIMIVIHAIRDGFKEEDKGW